jgi:8-oxo-dGTP pyrophosphatase MutT (NUDIX family)
LKTQSKRTRSKRAKKELSAGAIVFTIQGSTIKILRLLANKPGEYYVEIGPKGHVEKGETPLQAANREIKEEIGVPLHIDSNFRETEKYLFTRDLKNGEKEKVDKTNIYFVAFIDRKGLRQISLSDEHLKYFLTPIDEAIEKEKFKENRKMLEKVRPYLITNYLVLNPDLRELKRSLGLA